MMLLELDAITSLAYDLQRADRKHGETSLQAVTAKAALFAALDAAKNAQAKAAGENA